MKMTIEKAIQQLKSLKRNREHHFSEDDSSKVFRDDAEACAMGIEALEKQTPKKPINSDSEMFCLCPSCNHFINKNEASHGNIDIPFCKWCGQALDWED